MPRKKKVNPEKLIEAVQSELPSTEIMDQFRIKTSAQLKSLYLDALVMKGLVKEISGRGSRGTANPDKQIQVNKRGSLIIPRELVEEMGFKIDDTFSVKKSKSGMSLKKG
jgi:hypothetical protein